MIPSHPRAATPSHTLRLPPILMHAAALSYLGITWFGRGEEERRRLRRLQQMVGPGTSVASAAGCCLLYPCTGESWCSPSLLLAKTTSELRLLVAVRCDGVFPKSSCDVTRKGVSCSGANGPTIIGPIILSSAPEIFSVSILREHTRKEICLPHFGGRCHCGLPFA
ncbi:hypothetical protein B296_00021242 [Ensete ventricosum]|uniref:Uncharacterized protein n=1 Tax=Ensete ventricosum TaxID=4639 RepID=A0A427A3C3_ENSVE|nr:hypothetical protein B296_00021242 [Ensete ventricosum]